jgi:hypothetical protein
MFGLVIVDHEAGVHHARNPAEQSEEQTQDEAENAARHQDRHRRHSYTEKIPQRFHVRADRSLALDSDGRIGFLQRTARIAFPAFAQFLLRMDALFRLIRLGLGGRGRSAAGKEGRAHT